MSDAEKKEIKSVVKAFTDEEKVLVARSLPNDVLVNEIERRIRVATKKLDTIMYALTEKEDDPQE